MCRARARKRVLIARTSELPLYTNDFTLALLGNEVNLVGNHVGSVVVMLSSRRVPDALAERRARPVRLFVRGARMAAMTDVSGEFPGDVELTHLLVISDLARAVHFYRDVVGAELVREYGGTSAVFRLAGTWLLLVTAGGPTADKPTVTFAPPDDPDRVSSEMTFRVRNCRAVYALLTERGAGFLTPPVDHGYEVRCFFRDPDGHLLELSEVPQTP
jgi:catechol 2,3-dioxygenase-like lactoylglutathione lyase family enzyme